MVALQMRRRLASQLAEVGGVRDAEASGDRVAALSDQPKLSISIRSASSKAAAYRSKSSCFSASVSLAN